jgi:hypothetical protein
MSWYVTLITNLMKLRVKKRNIMNEIRITTGSQGTSSEGLIETW